MRVAFVRKGLSASVSVIGLCVGGAALAQTVPGADLPLSYTVDAADVITTGVTDIAAPNAMATVNTVPSGTFTQTYAGASNGDDADLFLENAGSVGIFADAVSTPDAGFATQADAGIEDAIYQVVTSPNAVLTATMINSGDLTIGATADASGTANGGDVVSNATASLVGGVHQEATVEGGGDGSATVTGTNDGTYEAFAQASASSDGDSNADAVLEEAIFMRSQANGAGDGTTLTTLTNNGELDFWASAVSDSRDGNATASAAAGGANTA